MAILKRIALALMVLALMGQDDCESETPPDEIVSEYCHGNDYNVLDRIEHGYDEGGVTGALEAIIGGDPSDDMRATVHVAFGRSSCTGVHLGGGWILTAAHCGYGTSTVHSVRTHKRSVDGKTLLLDEKHTATKHIPHPDYLKYVYSGNTDLEARKADLMLLYVPTFPVDYPTPHGIYSSIQASQCAGLVAQGYGTDKDPDTGFNLNETEYVITKETDKYLISRASNVPDDEEHGRICFGDSGGPLYADVAGHLHLAGITTTTMSSDCLIGGTHVNLFPLFWRDWVIPTIAANHPTEDAAFIH